jgi:hypothetical protein
MDVFVEDDFPWLYNYSSYTYKHVFDFELLLS